MSNNHRTLLSTLLLIVCARVSPAQDSTAARPVKVLSQYKLDVWADDSGLPQNSVRAIAQSHDGYLWLATEEGLARFDGSRFEVFNELNTPALKSSWIIDVLADDRILWVATNGGGLGRLRDRIFTRIGKEHGLSSDFLTTLFLDRAGALWIGTEGGGINTLDNGKIVTYGAEHGLPAASITSIAQDHTGRVWVGTHAGLFHLERGRFEKYRAAGLGDALIHDVLVAGDGARWIATSKGISRMIGNRVKSYTTRTGLVNDYVFDVYEDGNGAIWAATSGGVTRFYGDSFDSLGLEDGLPTDLILTVTADREGNFWLGTNGGGLVRVKNSNFAVFGKREGLSHDIALAVMEDQTGAMWIGTAGGGLNKLSGGMIKTYSKANGLTSNMILSLAFDETNSIWVGTPQGLNRIGLTGIATYQSPDGLTDNQVNALLADRSKRLWVGTWGGGLQRWLPTRRTLTQREGLASNFVTALHEDRSGNVWVGTRDGLSRITSDQITTITTRDGLSGDYVSALYEDADGALWIGTESRGINYFANGRVVQITQADGLFDNRIHSIIGDNSGNLWLSSNKGIFTVGREDIAAFIAGRSRRIRSTSYGVADGLRSREANGGVQPAAWKRRDGTLWFPTLKGAATIDPARIMRNTIVPPVVLERVVVNGTPIIPGSSNTLPRGERNLEMHFTANSFVAPENLRFRYKLEGFDDQWVEAGTRRVAYYPQLPPGTYNFRVIAANNDGVWNLRGAGADIAVPPYFHETAWFRLLALAIVLSMIGWWYRRRIHHLQRRHAELTDLVKERTLAEASVRDSREQLRLALEAGKMGTWDWNIATGEVKWSSGLGRMTGMAEGTFGGDLEAFRQTIHPEDREQVMKEMDKALRNRASAWHIEYRIVLPNSEIRWIEGRGDVSFDNSGEPTHMRGVALDATERREQVEALRESNAQLRQAQKMEALGKLAGGVAHDFNNLLTAITGHTELLIEQLPQEGSMMEDAKEVQAAAIRAASLTRQLLAFSRKEKPQREPVSLETTIQDMIRMLSRVIGENVRLETHLASGSPMILADRASIEQIIMNLVVNARDAMAEGGQVTIQTRTATLETGHPIGLPGPIPAGSYVVLSVSDSGVGMDRETQSRIFEPFFTTKQAGKGTGLGLSTVYGIVEQSNAYMSVSSELGVGTTFKIYFPVVNEPRVDNL